MSNGPVSVPHTAPKRVLWHLVTQLLLSTKAGMFMDGPHVVDVFH